MTADRQEVPRAALASGRLGSAPGAGALPGTLWGGFAGHPAGAVLPVCGAVILSFMGGVRRGLGMAARAGWKRYAARVVPPLPGWAAVHVSGDAGKPMLAGAFLGLMFHDERTVRAGEAPVWYPRLRRPLTVAVVLCLVPGRLAA